MREQEKERKAKMTTKFLDPKSEIDLVIAGKVSRGEMSSEGLRVLSRTEYLRKKSGNYPCVHPQGWPCFTSCLEPLE